MPRTLAFAFLFFFLGITRFASGNENLRLEGIAYDDKDSSRSLAVINAMPLQEGDTLEHYTIVSIKRDIVILKNNDSGETSNLTVRGLAPSERPQPQTVNEETTDEVAEADRKIGNILRDPDKNMSEKVGELLDGLKRKPQEIANLTMEMKMVYHLVIINNASVRYYQKNTFFPQHINQLTLDGFLDKKYEAPTFNKLTLGGYVISFGDNRNNPDRLSIHADPENRSKGMRHLFIGQDAIIRVESGKQATMESPPHKYNQKLQGGYA